MVEKGLRTELVASVLGLGPSYPFDRKVPVAAVMGMAAEHLGGWHLVSTCWCYCRLVAAEVGRPGGIVLKARLRHKGSERHEPGLCGLELVRPALFACLVLLPAAVAVYQELEIY